MTDRTKPALARYPGRACLLGEHCDWAGGSSLAVPLPMGITVRGEDATEPNRITIEAVLDGVKLHGDWHRSAEIAAGSGPLRFVPAALVALRARGNTPPATALEVTSDLPAGRGFSSSAAFTLAVVDVLTQRSGHTLQPLEAADIAYQVEHDLLGVDCGRLDQIACASRAPVFIRWAEGAHDVRPVQPGAPFHLVVVALPTPRDTPAILSALRRDFMSPDSSAAKRAFRIFADSAEAGVEALEQGDAALLGSAMNEAQSAYREHFHRRLPELRAPALEQACADLVGRGALGAKFSGAGGEGSVVALFASREKAVDAVAKMNAGRLAKGYYALVQ